MTKLKLKRKTKVVAAKPMTTMKPKTKVKVIVLSGAALRRKAEETIRQLEATAARRASERNAYQRSERVEKPIRFMDEQKQLSPKAVHTVTDGSCWRPDLFYKGGRACDYCGLYQYCKAQIKRLKDPTTQPKDGNAKLEEDAERERKAKMKIEIVRPKKKVVVVRPAKKVILVKKRR